MPDSKHAKFLSKPDTWIVQPAYLPVEIKFYAGTLS